MGAWVTEAFTITRRGDGMTQQKSSQKRTSESLDQHSRPGAQCGPSQAVPHSIEEYYQQIGRAGRDGLRADCVLFYSSRELQDCQRSAAERLRQPSTRAGSPSVEMRDWVAHRGCRHQRLTQRATLTDKGRDRYTVAQARLSDAAQRAEWPW